MTGMEETSRRKYKILLINVKMSLIAVKKSNKEGLSDIDYNKETVPCFVLHYWNEEPAISTGTITKYFDENTILNQLTQVENLLDLQDDNEPKVNLRNVNICNTVFVVQVEWHLTQFCQGTSSN